MSWLSVGKLLGGGILDGVNSIIKTTTGDRTQEEANTHSEQDSATQAFAAEVAAQARTNRTWWDSFIDGLNRLPRPLMVFSVLGLFVYCFADPAGFSVRMQAFALVPEWLALVLAQVILLYFGGRMFENWPGKLSGPTKVQVQEVMASMRELRQLQKDEAPPAPIPEAEYQAAMKDTSRPLPNRVIEEWNRRRNNGG
jgi:uncharacterized membrane protein YgcG